MSSILSRAVAVFDRMSVKHQMHSAFAAVLLLMAALGGASLWALIQEDAQARELSEKWLRGVGVLAQTRVAVVEARDMEVKHSRTSDRSYHSEYEEKIAASAKLVADNLAAYQAKAVADDDTKLLTELKKTWSGYLKSSEQVIALGKQKKQQDAADISDGAAAMALDETLLSLDKLAKYNFAGGDAAAANATATFVKARTAVIGLLGAALVLGIGMAWLITRRLYAQLGGEPRVAVQLATAVAAGDLSTPIHVPSGDSSSLLAQLAAMQRSLVGAVSSVRQGSENVAAASAQIAQGNQDLSQRTEEQAGALQKTASTMDELGSTVSNNADNARQANQLAIGASEVAVKGGEVVGQVVDTMKAINESSKKIADIISVIDGIAFQTNILALNAAVEAARAGEQGRGFAVVAAEVRSLAQRSAEAAKEIKSLITASVDRVEHGTQLVDQAGHTMEEIVGAIKRVTDIVGEISSASHEQSVGVSQVGEAVTQMDRATQQNAAMVEQSASAAMSLQQQAQQLVQAVAVFKLSGSDMSHVALSHSRAVVPTPVKAAPKAPAAPVDRRGPNRAKNVERLKPAPKFPATPQSAKPPVSQPASASAKTGTDDWESF